MIKTLKRSDSPIQPVVKENNDSYENEDQSWSNWCRLCAKDDPDNGNVFLRNEGTVLDMALATAIGKYFWVNIKPGDVLPQCLCMECETLITELCDFSERINKVQTMFTLLQNSIGNDSIDPNELRLQFGLLDEERQHIIRSGRDTVTEFHVDQKKEIDEQHQEHEESEDEIKVEGDVGEDDVGEDDVGEDDVGEDDEAEDDEQQIQEQELDAYVMVDTDIMSSQHSEGTEIFEEEDLELELATDDYDERLVDNFEVTELLEGEVVLPIVKKRNMEIKELVSEQNAESSENVYDLEMGDMKIVEKEKRVELVNKDEKLGDKDMEPLKLSEQLTSTTENSALTTKSLQKVVLVDGPEGSKIICLPEKRRRGRPKLNENPTSSKKRRTNVDGEGEEFRFECSQCTKKYKGLVVFRRHMQDAHNIIDETVVEYTCGTCLKTFTSERQLTVHERIHLPLELKQVHPCPYCDKRFTKGSILVNHISGTHLNEKPFVCEECGRALKTLAALKEHKLTHTDECPFECEVCHKRFKNKARLKIHSDVHTTTSYDCNICGVQLNTRRTLNMHMLVHSDVKAFKCDYCGHEFKRGKALKNHLIIHSGLKPYTCNFCQKTFSNGSNCRSHKKKAHPEELAAMEAEGKRTEPPKVPKLNHLRQVTKASEPVKPIKPATKPKGLPKNWREILLKAEARANEILQDAPSELIEDELAAIGQL